jgi:hypothetical protein
MMNGTGWTTYNYLLLSLNIDITRYILFFLSFLLRRLTYSFFRWFFELVCRTSTLNDQTLMARSDLI